MFAAGGKQWQAQRPGLSLAAGSGGGGDAKQGALRHLTSLGAFGTVSMLGLCLLVLPRLDTAALWPQSREVALEGAQGSTETLTLQALPGSEAAGANNASAAPVVRPKRIGTKVGSVAICLAGGLRIFEVTASSLVQHMFRAYPGADVYVHTQVDPNCHKLLLLKKAAGLMANYEEGAKNWTLQGVRFLGQAPLDESSKAAQYLQVLGSPNGVQGLLQYFELNEGCADLIEAGENRLGFRYDWIVRTRPDGFWVNRPPPVEKLSPEAYTFPEGSAWGGYNDRFGAAKRHVAMRSMRRLRVLRGLEKVFAAGTKKTYNSESVLKAHLELLQIKAQGTYLPFCVICSRSFIFPLPPGKAPIFALTSTAPLNGAYCRPCKPVLKGMESLKVVKALKADEGLPWVPPRRGGVDAGYDLCNGSIPLRDGWEGYFDAHVGLQTRSLRRMYVNMNFDSCVEDLEHTLSGVEDYKGPSAYMLCKLKQWTPVFQALADGQATKASIFKVLETMSPGTMKGVFDLKDWEGGEVPLPELGASKTCDPCHLLVEGRGRMGKKLNELKLALQDRGWYLVKCAGASEKQECLFLMFNKPLTR